MCYHWLRHKEFLNPVDVQVSELNTGRTSTSGYLVVLKAPNHLMANPLATALALLDKMAGQALLQPDSEAHVGLTVF